MNIMLAWNRAQGITKFDGIVSPAYSVFEVISDSDHRFLDYLVRCDTTCAYFKAWSYGIIESRLRLYPETFGSLFCALPTLDEQRIIADHLDRATSRIDTLVAKKTRFIELLQEEVISLATSCQAADSTRWIRLRHVSDIQSRPVDMQSGDKFTRLGLYNRGRGIFKKDSADTEDMGESSFHWVEDGDLILSGQFAWEGAVAMARHAHAGCVVSHRYPIVRGKPGEALAEYLYAYFQTAHGDMVLNDCSRGSAGRNRPLNMGLLMNWKIPIPPLPVQKRIATLLRKKERAEALQKRSIELLREHRTALITAAVTGKIDLRPAA
ncbi:MAG: restriction endonuclease subunit S [Stenotrophomonas sp.]